MTLSRLKALALLNECTGADIWSLETCRRKGVPEDWIEELADCFESGFKSDQEVIYHHQQRVNQYHGIHDLELARKIAELFNVNTRTIVAPSRSAEVRAIKEAVDEA